MKNNSFFIYKMEDLNIRKYRKIFEQLNRSLSNLKMLIYPQLDYSIDIQAEINEQTDELFFYSTCLTNKNPYIYDKYIRSQKCLDILNKILYLDELINDRINSNISSILSFFREIFNDKTKPLSFEEIEDYIKEWNDISLNDIKFVVEIYTEDNTTSFLIKLSILDKVRGLVNKRTCHKYDSYKCNILAELKDKFIEWLTHFKINHSFERIDIH